MDDQLLRGERVTLTRLNNNGDAGELPVFSPVTLHRSASCMPGGVYFKIMESHDGRAMGVVGLYDMDPKTETAWLQLDLNEAEAYDRDHEMEALMLVLRYAFTELSLHRINLDLITENEKRIGFFEDCGFRYEGTQREVLCAGDAHLGIINMGALRSEWTRAGSITA